uniref:Auxin-responsive protein n=1 Tax=Brassica campestris TaxID=3711 RepID=M4EMB4_BRACM
MKRLQGFKIFKWIIRSRRIQTGKRQCLTGILNPVSRICYLARCLRRGASRLCGGKKTVQTRLGNDPESLGVPKGHLVVHVGESGDDTRRVVVPVFYFNHPLFGELTVSLLHIYFRQAPRKDNDADSIWSHFCRNGSVFLQHHSKVRRAPLSRRPRRLMITDEQIPQKHRNLNFICFRDVNMI